MSAWFRFASRFTTVGTTTRNRTRLKEMTRYDSRAFTGRIRLRRANLPASSMMRKAPRPAGKAEKTATATRYRQGRDQSQRRNTYVNWLANNRMAKILFVRSRAITRYPTTVVMAMTKRKGIGAVQNWRYTRNPAAWSGAT